MSGSVVDRDIFGNPIEQAGERRGRPKHKPTEQSRMVVQVMSAVNKRNGEIAEAIGISEPTLRKAYKSELHNGRAQIRAEVLFRMMEQVRAGNVSAMNLILRQFDQADVTEAARYFDGAEPPQPRQTQIGKKEAAAEAATTAGVGTDWGDDLHPGGLKLN
ncbi:hypothetical protein [Chenggangzhangella methanolivorans]|uniref:Uncharacterized protein n=1 Tax=Chenggangzhangella methanolivorans TaxID=1437009 RepID=A0A9E6R7P5_9HYPH|nr:hypothetical protein [Chenggangzhangella methanolivorans]QZN99533.1 hypothetical protein K6K41_22945 [Chenggangzhangella methanolivorans]